MPSLKGPAAEAGYRSNLAVPMVHEGEVVGLVFDGNIHSLGGTYWFDEAVNRSVSVHSVALVEALRKVYRAERLVKELEAGPAAPSPR